MSKGYSFESDRKFPKISKGVQIFIVIIAILFIGGLFGSNLTGFFAYQDEENVELVSCKMGYTEIEDKNIELSNTVESLKSLNKQLADELSNNSLAVNKHDEIVDEYEEKLNLMKGNLDTKEIELSESKSDLTVAEEAQKTAEAKLDEVQKKYDDIVQKYVNRMCCQLNFFGFNYKFYDVVGNDIVCLSSGTKEVKC